MPSLLIWVSCGVVVGLVVAALWGRTPKTLHRQTLVRTRLQMILACLVVAGLSGWLFGFFVGDKNAGFGSVSAATFGAILAGCAMWWHGIDTIRSNQPQYFRII